MPDDRPKATVLLVEDDMLIRMHGMDILEHAGFDVLEASNGDDALVILGEHLEVSLLFSDVDMPGSIDGLELAREVHRLRPDIRLLLTSGHHCLSDHAVPDDGKFLRKPWTEQALIEKVRAVLH